jgi:hypothetical protein
MNLPAPVAALLEAFRELTHYAPDTEWSAPAQGPTGAEMDARIRALQQAEQADEATVDVFAAPVLDAQGFETITPERVRLALHRNELRRMGIDPCAHKLNTHTA